MRASVSYLSILVRKCRLLWQNISMAQLITYVQVFTYHLHIYTYVAKMSAKKRFLYRNLVVVVVVRILSFLFWCACKRRRTGLCHFGLFWLPFRIQFNVDLVFSFPLCLNSRLIYGFGDANDFCCNDSELASIAGSWFWTWAVANRLPKRW